VFKQDTETALLIMQSVTKSFMIEAFLRQKEITQDSMTLWSEITDWIFACPEWNPAGDSEYLDREFISCALAMLFCVAPDFSPLICGIDPGWPHLSKFVKLLERATKEFGTEAVRALEVNPNVLHRWRREFRTGPGNVFPGHGKQRWAEGLAMPMRPPGCQLTGMVARSDRLGFSTPNPHTRKRRMTERSADRGTTEVLWRVAGSCYHFSSSGPW